MVASPNLLDRFTDTPAGNDVGNRDSCYCEQEADDSEENADFADSADESLLLQLADADGSHLAAIFIHASDFHGAELSGEELVIDLESMVFRLEPLDV